MSDKSPTKKLSFKHEWNEFSIYCWSLMEKCLTKLKDNERAKFKTDITESETSLEKVRVVIENEQVMSYLHDQVDYLNSKNKIDQKKDNKFALSCKKIGDAYLGKKKYQKTLKFYSKSILFFDNESTGFVDNDSADSDQSSEEEVSLCSLYINRAKVLIKLEQFDNAYADFRRAIELEPETRNIDFNLDDLAMHYKPKTVNFNMNETNEKLDGASAAVRMDYCEAKGRMIYSERKIEEGEILFMEEPYVHWLRPSYYETYCHQCLKRLSKHVFVPCNSCTEIRYCSTECRDVSWERYHKTECKYLKVLKKWPSGHMALRLVLRDGLEYALEENRKQSEPLSVWPKLGFKRDYSSIKSLTGEENFKDGDYYCPLIIGCVLIGLLFEMNKEIKKQDLEEFSAILIKSIMQILENTFMIYDYDIKTVEEDDFLEEESNSIEASKNSINLMLAQSKFHQMSSTSFKIGVGLYSSTSLIPHSCDNNCNKYYSGSSILIVSAKSIKENDEVNIEYGVHYKMNSLKYRKDYLNNNFGFDCKCVACLNGYENVGLAYKCLKCQTGALIMNQDSTNYCMNCGVRDLDVSSLDQLIKNADEHFQNGAEAHKENNMKKAELEFRAGEKICTKVYYSNTKLQFIKSELSHLYVMKKNYALAYQYLLETLPVNQDLYGEHSIEVLSNHVELAYLAIECIENLGRTGFSVKHTSQKLFRQLMIRISNKSRDRNLEQLNLDKIEKKLSDMDELSKWKMVFKRHYQTILQLYYMICRRDTKIASEESISSLRRLASIRSYYNRMEN